MILVLFKHHRKQAWMEYFSSEDRDHSHSSTTATAVVGFGRGSGTAGIRGLISGAENFKDSLETSLEGGGEEGDTESTAEQNRRGKDGGFRDTKAMK